MLFLQIAHISDLHFSKLSFSCTQFFSKRWLGNFHLLFHRNRNHSNKQPFSLPKLFATLGVTHVIITGDLTTTSLTKEYELASLFINQLHNYGIKIFSIPGNHDHYTKNSYKNKLFYRYFPNKFPTPAKFNLRDHGVALYQLTKEWFLLLLDTTLATSLFSSNGFFSPTIESNLLKILALIPKDKKIILANHFPFSSPEKPNRHLLRRTYLQKMLQVHPQIKFYLHGHTHKQHITDLRSSQLPIVVNSGSASFQEGSWNLLRFYHLRCDIDAYLWQNNHWHIKSKYTFQWTP